MGICSSVECAGGKKGVVNGILLFAGSVIIRACSLSLSLSLPVDIDGIDCLLACGVQEKERVAALNGNLVLKPKKINSFLFLHFSSRLLHTERVVNTIVI
jgi:hypothetical protein